MKNIMYSSEDMNNEEWINDPIGFEGRWFLNDDDVWEQEQSDHYILDDKLMVVIDRSEWAVAQGEPPHLAKMARKYMEMLRDAETWDWVDIMPLPETMEVRITDGWSNWLEPIPYHELPRWNEWELACEWSEE